ncbi:MAG: sulfatase family protein [Longimicrobiales bacterium]
MHHASMRFLNAHRTSRLAALLPPSLLWLACGGPAPLTVDTPLHLEEHVSSATITGSEVPANPPQPVEWRFDQPQPDWKATPMWNAPFGTAALARTGEGLRVTLTDLTRNQRGTAVAGIHVDVPDWDRGDWADVVIRARADSGSSVAGVTLAFNLREAVPGATDFRPAFHFGGQSTPIVRDGAVQTYRLRVHVGSQGFHGPWRQLVLWFWTDGEPGSIDLLSVSAVPAGAVYAEAPHGVRPVSFGDRIRRTLFTHAPGRFSYRVRVPEGGRLDTGLGVLEDDADVTFRVAVQAGGQEETLFEESHADRVAWAQRSVDLSRYAGQTVTLALETRTERPGTLALWGAPTVSGRRSSEMPNVIFYVIDGGAADQMSVYGYNRRTTPNLERLAAEGALFEYAYSNSSSTKPSTASFMTSLHHSVLGAPEGFEPLPAEARTMAERFHEAGYQTAVFTSNPWAGAASNLERGVDVFRDEGAEPHSRSSVELHREFWDWRGGFPGEPYWVHFQTTDVHAQHLPTAPFQGLFAPGGTSQLAQWRSDMREWGQRNAARLRTDPALERNRWAESGVDRVQWYNLWRALYDETMAHQDYQLGRLVARLRETGQWEHTLLIIAADHSILAGSDDFLTALASSRPYGGELMSSSTSRVPLLFVWPGNIVGGQRFGHPVSMIDVLPTVLELAGLPPAETLQGQSLAPLLRGRAGWQPRPVIFDDFEKDPRTGELRGAIAMLDGRWGASLWIGPPADTPNRRPTPLLLFDVWNDPLALAPVNDAYPELVTKYTALLEKQWEAHRLLATRFTPGGKVELTPAQLEALRALGYIR